MFFNNTTAYAHWTDSPIDFFNTYGENSAVYNLEGSEGYFYFGQRGVSRTSNYNYYKIVGFQFSVTSPSGVRYSSRFSVPIAANKIMQEKANGYTYDLWKFSLTRLTYDLSRKNPGVDFSFIRDGSYGETRFLFDAIVIMYNYQGNNLGNIDSNGEHAWGKIIESWNDPDWNLTLANGSIWTPSVAERKALYGILGKVPGSSKPTFYLTVSAFPLKQGQISGYPGAKYVVGNDYWVNLKEDFTIYSESKTRSTGGYPDYNYLTLNLNGDGSTPGTSSSFYDGTIRGVGPYFKNYFTMTGWAPSTSTSGGYNYRYTKFKR